MPAKRNILNKSNVAFEYLMRQTDSDFIYIYENTF